jgi:hypothetical protein
MNWDRLEQARESLCGWSGCEDCQFLREAIAEIECLRPPDGRLAVMLTVDHVEREATQTPSHAIEDLRSVADACYIAWVRYTEQENQ